jgi:ATP-dependent Clp protease ATP-binding subunit ClpA
MFERFTERARHAVVLAQDEARALRHDYIGTEHMLLGLLREEEGIAARALTSLRITVEEVRARVVRIVGQGTEVTTGQIPFTPRAKTMLELAPREAFALGHNYIGTEHLLLGLVRENEGVASQILLDLGAGADTVREEILGTLAGGTGSGHSRPGWSGDVAGRPRRARLDREPMTGPPRFTQGARKALVLAQEEARSLGHAKMGTEHVLLGLLREDHELGARLLAALGITVVDLRAQVIRVAGDRGGPTTGHIQFTPQVRDVLEHARREARSLGHDCVGTEHLLLSLMREHDGTAARILREHRG